MSSQEPVPKWASEPCAMGIDEAGRGPVLGPMVYGCLYCSSSYLKDLSSLNLADSKTLKEEKREELFENLKANESIGWAVDVIDPRELSSKMLNKNKINLNEISHDSAIGLVAKVLGMGVLLTEVYVDTVGDAEKYRIKLSEKFPTVKFIVAKKADSLYPVVSGASIIAKVTRDRALREWTLDETAENLHRNYGSGYPGDPTTKSWLEDHKHSVFGFPTLVRFSWGTCTPYFKDIVEVSWESDKVDEDGPINGSGKKQLRLSNVGITTSKRKSEDIESNAKGRCKFFQKACVLFIGFVKDFTLESSTQMYNGGQNCSYKNPYAVHVAVSSIAVLALAVMCRTGCINRDDSRTPCMRRVVPSTIISATVDTSMTRTLM